MPYLSRPRRYPLLLPLRVLVSDWGKRLSTVPVPAAEEETITTNISSAGCYFLLSEKPVVGSAVQMEIAMAPESGKKLPSKVVALGRVVRVDKKPAPGKTGVACEFGRTDLVRTSEES